MMSTFMGLEIGKRGVLTAATSLNVTAHNIANANTEGYTRQRADLVATSPFTTPSMQSLAYAGQIGTGVEAAQITRLKDQFLDNRIYNEQQKFTRYESVYDNLQQVELFFNEPSEDGLRSVLDKFWQSLEDAANDPETPATRQVVIENGISLANSFSQAHEELYTLRDNLNDEIIDRVDQVNRLVQEAAGLNQQIANVKNLNQNPNDLLDRRDVILGELSQLININTITDTEDEIVVTVNGKPIIQGDYFNQLTVTRNDVNDELVDVRWEKDFIPLSSNTDVLSVFANSSAANQSHAVEVKRLARAHKVEGTDSIVYEERALASADNDPTITSGSFNINGVDIFIDSEKDTLNDVVKYINDSGSGVTASLDENRLVLEANDSGLDNRIVLKTGTSNFLRKIGMVNGMAGNIAFTEKDAALGLGPGSFDLDGTSITVTPTQTLEEIVNNINNEDIDVRAQVEELDDGTYRIALESDNGDYNFEIDDTGSGILAALGIDYGTSIPAGGPVIMGNMISDTPIDDKYERGLSNVVPTTFEIEDMDGDIATITINDTNDSLELIKDEINSQLTASNTDAVAKIITDQEGKSRLYIHTEDDREWAIRKTAGGNLLEDLGIMEGTYNQIGPLDLKPQDALFNFNGSDYTWGSNRVEGFISDITFDLREKGFANITVRKLFSGGKIKGLLEARDEIVSKYMDNLDELAYSVAKNVNSLHFEGFGSDGKSQRLFFENYKGVVDGQPQRFAARSLAVDREMQLDVKRLATATKDPYNTDSKGLPVSEGVGSGTNALDIAKLKFDLTMSDGTATFNEFFNQTISEIGTKANDSGRIRDNQDLLMQKLDNIREQTSGVSLDEEMANMVKFQHAYNAAAKVITTQDQMLQTILGLVS